MSFLDYQNKNPEFLNNYLKYKRFIQTESETTVNEIYIDLRTLLRYIKLTVREPEKLKLIDEKEFKKIDIKDVTLTDINEIMQIHLDRYLLFLCHKMNNNAKTRNRKLASIKDFFKYLCTTNQISSNPSKWIKAAPLEKRQPKYLNLEESKKLLSDTINSNQLYKTRNYAITCIFLNCSLRLSELVNLNLSDIKIDKSEQTIKVHGKGNKERILYLNPAVCEALEEYLEIRTPLDRINKDYNALFLSSRNKRISRRAVQTIIKSELAKTLNEKSQGFHTHSLRHTGPTLLYNEKNTDLMVLNFILGHKSLSTTEIYTHVSDRKMKEI